MEILKVTAENFRTFKKLELDFNTLFQDDNILFIKGNNLSNPSLGSNGAGKSMVADIISWGLYGKAIRTTRSSFPVNAGSNTRVVLELRDPSCAYRITRSRSSSKYTTEISREGVDITRATNELTDLYIRSIIGIDYDTFKCTTAFAQRDNNRFIARNDKQRKELLLAATNLKDILFIPKLAKKEIDELQDNIHASEIRLEKYNTEIVRQNERITANKEAKENWQRDKAERIKKIEEEIIEIDLEIENINRQISNNNKKLEIIRGKMKQAEIERTKFVNKGNGLKDEISKIADKSIEKDKTHGILMATYQTLKENLERLDGKGECPTCNQKVKFGMTKTLRTQVEERFQQVREMKASVRYLQSQSLELQMIVEDCADKRKVIEGDIELSKWDYDQTDRGNVTFNSKIESLTESYRDKKTEIKIIKNETKDFDSKIAECSAAHAQAEKRHKNCLDKMEYCRGEIEVLEFIKNSCGPKGIIASALPEVISTFEQLTNQYLEKITEGHMWVRFDIDIDAEGKRAADKFNIMIYDKDKEDPVLYEEWSGGERTRIETAINLALSKIVSSKLNFSIFDEDIFQGLEEEGLRYTCALLEREASEDSRKFIVISHQPYVESCFSNQVTVVKRDGVSFLQS